jgi:hypothetical protein
MVSSCEIVMANCAVLVHGVVSYNPAINSYSWTDVLWQERSASGCAPA